MHHLCHAGRGDGDVSENEFVDKMMRRLEGHGTSLTTSVKNDADWESFKSATFSHKVNFLTIRCHYTCAWPMPSWSLCLSIMFVYRQHS